MEPPSTGADYTIGPNAGVYVGGLLLSRPPFMPSQEHPVGHGVKDDSDFDRPLV